MALLSTALKITRRIDLSISTAVKRWRGSPHWSTNKCRSIHSVKDRFSTYNSGHDFGEIGYTVDVADLLSSPERDFLLKYNGEKVPISFLEGKLIGLYFCENVSSPLPRMQAIKKVYEEAKSRGYDFEIVQITFHYHPFYSIGLGTDPTVKQCHKDINWLTVPFKDPSCRKIQQVIFECIDDKNKHWNFDCLVLIHPCQAGPNDSSGVLFEFSGAEILEQWGIEGYPFTRQSLYNAQYELQKRRFTLQSLFPPGKCLLRRPRSAGDGFDLVDGFSQLSGKRVLVLYARHFVGLDWKAGVCVGNFISMLKSEYEAQVEDNVAEESKFEVVYVSTASGHESSFDDFTNDMPWLVRPFRETSWHLYSLRVPTVLAFNEQGELIAKDNRIGEKKEGYKLRFPFVDQDLEKCVREEVEGRCPSIQCKKNYDLSTAVKEWRGSDVSTAVKQCRVKGLPFSKKDSYKLYDTGYTVDVADLLTTPERDFLVKNNGQKIKVDDLRGKTIVLYIVPLDVHWLRELRDGNLYVTRPGEGDTWDMIDAYSELMRVGSDVEFVFVPVQVYSAGSVDRRIMSQEDLFHQEALFHQLFSTMPFPAVPFSDVQCLKDRVVQTFSVDECRHELPHWVVIDPNNTVVATQYNYPHLFKSYGGAELHPLSLQRIRALLECNAPQSWVKRIGRWDELLTSDTRDFLLSSNGDKVPISSLKDKLVGLYFCLNIPQPPRMQEIKKVYEEAKSRGYDFEIVQITYHYSPLGSQHILGTDPTVKQCCEHVSWLTLPFKDPSCRKVQHIFKWGHTSLYEDTLVLIHPDQDRVSFELRGAEILERWGIEGYPFTRASLLKAEYEVQKREIRLQLLFPPEESFLRSAGDGFDLVNAFSQLSGKRVLVFFAPHDEESGVGNFISQLKREYAESKFEVVYVSYGSTELSFDEFTKDMPWLVRPFSSELGRDLFCKVFRRNVSYPCSAVFNEQGELVSRKYAIGDQQFTLIDQDLEDQILGEVERECYCSDSDSDSDSDYMHFRE